jgi:hypothetical protein
MLSGCDRGPRTPSTGILARALRGGEGDGRHAQLCGKDGISNVLRGRVGSGGLVYAPAYRAVPVGDGRCPARPALHGPMLDEKSGAQPVFARTRSRAGGRAETRDVNRVARPLWHTLGLYVAPRRPAGTCCGPSTRKNDGQGRKRQVKGQEHQRRVEQPCHHKTHAAMGVPNSQRQARALVGMDHANAPSAE